MKKWILSSICLTIVMIVIVLVNNLWIDEKWVNIIFQILGILFGSSSAVTFGKAISINNQNKAVIKANGSMANSKITSIQGEIVNVTYASPYNEQIASLLEKTNNNLESTSKANTEEIVKKVIDKLRKEPTQGTTPTNDFLKRYLNEASNISDKDIQDIWTALFVSEVKEHNSIAIRTLDILKNLTKQEANLFRELSHYMFVNKEAGYIFKDIFTDISLLNVTKLADIGLIKQGLNLQWNADINDCEGLNIYNSDILCHVLNKSISITKLELNVYVLTDAGVQLYNALKLQMDDSNVVVIARFLKEHYAQYNVTAHRIVRFVPNGQIEYQINSII